jgi:radical SAM protein with 4Fe4S-binding SPASM domain
VVTILSPVAAFLWEGLGETETTVAELVARLTREYDVSAERAARDVDALVREWRARGLIRYSEATGGPEGSEGERPPDPRDKELLTRLATSLAVPITCDWEVTLRCNQRCLHCYVAAGTPLDGELDPDQALSVVAQLREMGCLFLALTGGEPLARRDLPALVREANQAGMRVTLLTNATLAGPAETGKLAEAGLRACEVSLYGGEPATHDAITRITGSFRATLNGVRAFRAAGVKVTLKFLAMRPAFDERLRVQDLALQLGAGFSLGPLITPTLRGGLEPCELRLTDDQLTRILAEGSYRPQEVRCEPATHKLRLGSDGSMYGCDFLPSPVGRLPARGAPLGEWRSPAALALRGAAWTQTPPPKCAGCPLRTTCPRCPGLAFLEHGSYEAVHLEACRIARLHHAATPREA